MKLICPQCKTSYEVTLGTLGSQGRQVRCARCHSTWFAEPPRLMSNVVPLPSHDARTAPLPGVVRTAAAPAAPQAAPSAPPPSGEAENPAPEPAAPSEELTAAAEPAPEPEASAADAEPAAEWSAEVAPGDPAAPAEAPDAAMVAGLEDRPDAPEAHPDLPQAAASDAAGETGPETAPATEPPVDIETIAARRLKARRPLVKRRPPRATLRTHALAVAIIALAFVNAGLIVCRADVVRMWPQTASLFEAIGLPVNLRDLAFENVKLSQEAHDGANILVVEGTIRAIGRGVADVPRLRFSIAAGNGHEIYAWTALPTRSRLAPGETLAFRTRLASPPEQGRSVKVRFFTRLDFASGLR